MSADISGAECSQCAACAACDGSCGVCPYADQTKHHHQTAEDYCMKPHAGDPNACDDCVDRFLDGQQ